MTAKKDTKTVHAVGIEIDPEHDELVSKHTRYIVASVQAMLDANFEQIAEEFPTLTKHEARVLIHIIANSVASIVQDLENRSMDKVPRIRDMMNGEMAIDETKYQR